MGQVFFCCLIAILGAMVVVLLDRYGLERLRHELDDLKLRVEFCAPNRQGVAKRERP